jgi:hypothetical protein
MFCGDGFWQHKNDANTPTTARDAIDGCADASP